MIEKVCGCGCEYVIQQANNSKFTHYHSWRRGYLLRLYSCALVGRYRQGGREIFAFDLFSWSWLLANFFLAGYNFCSIVYSPWVYASRCFGIYKQTKRLVDRQNEEFFWAFIDWKGFTTLLCVLVFGCWQKSHRKAPQKM